MGESALEQAPQLDGFSYVAHLGGGGFADVFLYRQHLPDRQVAVKVLRSTVDDAEALKGFNAEANLMAKVSTHPYIVAIHAAGVSTDRRPYLVMEYYPALHFGQRIKQGPMRVDKALEVTIKVAAAVETAHRARIVHRDIKPANVLVSEFGEPGLTDFGISAAHTDASPEESLGFSPPYAPPEIVSDEHPGDERSDIFSLAATMWAMLAGHSPFERPGGDNSRAEIMRRVLVGTVPPLGRSDVPPALELGLQQALSTDPSRRPQSARSFALMLQGVEHELGYRMTTVNLADEQQAAVIATPPIGAATVVGRVRVVSPDAPGPVSPAVGNRAAAAPTFAPGPGPTFEQAPLERPATAPYVEPNTWVRSVIDEAAGSSDTYVPTRPAPVDPAPAVAPDPARPRWHLLVGAAAVVVVVGAVAAVALMGGGTEARPGADTIPVVLERPELATAAAEVDSVAGLRGQVADGQVVFVWDPVAGGDVRYQVTLVGSDAPAVVVAETEYAVPGASACIRVLAFIPGVAEAEPTEACAP